MNCFLYSNPTKEPTEQLFANLMSKNLDFFSLQDSLFKVTKEKERSSRVVFWREFQVLYSFTLEISY